MDIFDEPIDADSYRVDAGSFEPVDRESSPYVEIDAQLEHRERDQTPLRFCLDGPGQDWKQRIVYTAGLGLSDRSNQTIPIFEIALPGSQGLEELNDLQTRRDDDELSAYTVHLRSFFVEEDVHNRLTGLGPIGKCLSLSQEQPVVLFLKRIDRVPGRAQSMFFGVLERNPRIQYGAQIEGEPTNLTIFTTTDFTAEREDLDRKLRSLLGGVYQRQGLK
jgi:hypothetical protein